MRIIQSFWSCNQTNLLTARSSWLAPEYKLMSWALSCLQLNKFYSNTVLYADSIAAKLLIDDLKLPYSDVVCCLDKLNTYHTDLWALAKIYAYAEQKKPFLHVDCDVYIWKAFDENLLNGELIAQSLEKAKHLYNKIMNQMEAELTYIPHIMKDIDRNDSFYCFNAGVLGGNDIDFFQEYCAQAFYLVNNNVHNLSRINVVDFNIYFEQFLFHYLAKKENKKVKLLLDDITDDGLYKGLGDFIEVPHNKQYLHLIGTYKRYPIVCTELANRLRLDYPEYYYRIIALFRNSSTPLAKDQYYFVNLRSDEDLSNRHMKLKENYAADKLEKKIKEKKSIHETVCLDISSIIEEAKNICDQNDKELSVISPSEIQLTDLMRFCQCINNTLRDKFSLLSKDYLYGRDLNATSYYQYLFGDLQTIYNKKLVADSVVEIVESKFDWSGLIECGRNKITNTNRQFANAPSAVCSAIIPECDTKGFVLSNMDELDRLIFETLKTRLTIQELLDIVEGSFDVEELKDARKEYETLIFERIENGIQHKIIKVQF
jgi:hypothetical protein